MDAADLIGIAVDGGGTKTTFVCHTLTNPPRILSRHEGSASNPNSVGDAAAFAVLSTGVDSVLSSASASKERVAAVTLGMSGVDRPADRTKVQGWFFRIFPHLAPSDPLPTDYVPDARVVVHNDGTAALSCGTKGKLEGVVVIAGTGTISLGYRHGSSCVRAAGWGARFDDEGCGYGIGAAVLAAAARAADGRGPETTLLKAVLEYIKAEKPEEMIPWAYAAENAAWEKVAALAPICDKCAKAGDEVAKQIIAKQTDGLVESISAVVKRLGYEESEPFDVVYAGGLLQHGVLNDGLTERLHKRFGDRCHPILSDEEPVMGAVYLNLKVSGIDI